MDSFRYWQAAWTLATCWIPTATLQASELAAAALDPEGMDAVPADLSGFLLVLGADCATLRERRAAGGSPLRPGRLVQARQGAVVYDLRSVRNGVEYSFHVLFVLDEDGVWRLWAL